MNIDSGKPNHPAHIPDEGYERFDATSGERYVTSGMPVHPDLYRTATRYAISQIDSRFVRDEIEQPADQK